jgi:hypothetical protein
MLKHQHSTVAFGYKIPYFSLICRLSKDCTGFSLSQEFHDPQSIIHSPQVAIFSCSHRVSHARGVCDEKNTFKSKSPIGSVYVAAHSRVCYAKTEKGVCRCEWLTQETSEAEGAGSAQLKTLLVLLRNHRRIVDGRPRTANRVLPRMAKSQFCDILNIKSSCGYAGNRYSEAG